jgi:hypothetical protein
MQEKKLRAWRYVLARLRPYTGSYSSRAMRRWVKCVSIDDDGCWIWTGPRGGGHDGGGPSFEWTVAFHHTKKGSAFWFMLRHWFPDVASRYTVGTPTYQICGKTMCVCPLCRRVRDAKHSIHNHKLTAEQVRGILYEPPDTPTAHLARKYEISPRTVANIRSGRSWKHVPDPRYLIPRHNPHMSEEDARAILAAKGLKSAVEVAKAYGVTDTHVRNIWAGRRRPELQHGG